MRHDKIKDMISAGMRLILVLLLCLATPTAMAETEAQRYRKIVSDMKKQGATKADVEREYKSLKSSNRYGGGALNSAARGAELDHYEKILKYWPAEGGSGEGRGYSDCSQNAINGAQLGQTLQELAGLSNDMVVRRSAAYSIDKEKNIMRGGIDCEIPTDPDICNLENRAIMDGSELLGMFESSKGMESSHAQQSERAQNSGGTIDDILTDDFMGSNSVSTNSFVNDIPIYEYEKAVEDWKSETGKYPEGSSEYKWARANYEEALWRLEGRKKAAKQLDGIETDLADWENDYKVRPLSEKKNAPKLKALSVRERKGDSGAYGNAKVNGFGIYMPKNQGRNRPKPILKSNKKQPVKLPPPPKGQVETYFQTINSDF